MTVPWVRKEPSSPLYYKLIIKKPHIFSELALNKFHLYATPKQQTRSLIDIEKHTSSPVSKIGSLENEEYLQRR